MRAEEREEAVQGGQDPAQGGGHRLLSGQLSERTMPQLVGSGSEPTPATACRVSQWDDCLPGCLRRHQYGSPQLWQLRHALRDQRSLLCWHLYLP